MNYLFFPPKWRKFMRNQKVLHAEDEWMDQYTISVMQMFPKIQSDYWEVGTEFIAFKCWHFYEYVISKKIHSNMHLDIAEMNPVYHVRYIL